MNPDQKPILILYGSQLGNACQLSFNLAQQCKQRGLHPIRSSFDSYNILKLPNETLALFVVSTTGQGEPPYNMKKAWDFLLRSDLPANSLEKLQFSVFGLGDSSYQYFNAMAKKLEKRLQQLGAKSICPKGLGDERNPKGHLAAYSLWIEKVWISLSKIFILESEEGKQFILPQLETKVEISEKIMVESSSESWKALPKPLGVEQEVMKGKKVAQSLETPKDYNRQTIYVEIELEKDEIIQPGDIFAIQPRNSLALCEQLAKRLKLNLDCYANIKGELTSKFPGVIKIRDLLELWLNISKPPSRYFLQLMSCFAKNQAQKEELIKMTSDKKEGIELYHKCCISDHKNIFEILNEFDSVELPFEYLLEGVELILPRQYSICTAHSYQTKKIELLMNIVEYESQTKKIIKGLCSNWIADLPLNSEIYYWIKAGSIPFPKQISNACIMIATGTGIAPFISHIQFREKMIKESEGSGKVLMNYLFFGCRHQKQDYYFEKYLKSQQENSNIEICPAFSRDQEEKVYVTNKISEKADVLAKYISANIENIKIIIVGTAKFMPQAIEMEFLEIFKLFCNDDIEEAMKLKEKLIEKKQYIVEAWS